jgi:L-asparagine transporter-like permease
MWGYPWLTYFTLVVMAVNIVAMAFIHSQRVPLLVGIASGLIVVAAYFLRSLTGRDRPASLGWQTPLSGRRET